MLMNCPGFSNRVLALAAPRWSGEEDSICSWKDWGRGKVTNCYESNNFFISVSGRGKQERKDDVSIFKSYSRHSDFRPSLSFVTLSGKKTLNKLNFFFENFGYFKIFGFVEHFLQLFF